MAHTQISGPRLPLKAASAVGAYLPVTFLPGGSALTETVRLAASWNEFQLGLTIATAASPGDPVPVAVHGEVAKGIAGASMGAGAFVAVGSTNGVLAPVAAVPAGPTGPPRFAIGIVKENHAAGDICSVYLLPGQVV